MKININLWDRLSYKCQELLAEYILSIVWLFGSDFYVKKIRGAIEKDDVSLFKKWMWFYTEKYNISHLIVMSELKTLIIKSGSIKCYEFLIKRNLAINDNKYIWSKSEFSLVCESVHAESLLNLMVSLFEYLGETRKDVYELDYSFRKNHNQLTMVDMIRGFVSKGTATSCLIVSNPIEILIKNKKWDVLEKLISKFTFNHWIFKNINKYLIFTLLKSSDNKNMVIELVKFGLLDLSHVGGDLVKDDFYYECNKIISSINKHKELTNIFSKVDLTKRRVVKI